MSINDLPPELLSKICSEFRLGDLAIDDDMYCRREYDSQPYRKFLRPLFDVNKAFCAAALENWHYKLDVAGTEHDKTVHYEVLRKKLCDAAQDSRFNRHVRKVTMCWHAFTPTSKNSPDTPVCNDGFGQGAKMVQSVLEGLPGLRELAIGFCGSCLCWLKIWFSFFDMCTLPKLTELSLESIQLPGKDPLCGSGPKITQLRRQLKRLRLTLMGRRPKSLGFQIRSLDDMNTLEHLHLGGTLSALGPRFILDLDLSNFRSSALSSLELTLCRVDGLTTARFLSHHISTLKTLVVDECELSGGTWQDIFESLLKSDDMRSLYFRSLRYTCMEGTDSDVSPSVCFVPKTPRFADTHTLADLIKKYRRIRGNYLSDLIVTLPSSNETFYEGSRSWEWRNSEHVHEHYRRPEHTHSQRLRLKQYIVEDPYAFEAVATMEEIRAGVPLGTGIVPRPAASTWAKIARR